MHKSSSQRRTRRRLAASLSIFSAFVIAPAAAQDYPSRQIQVLIPAPAGGSLDVGMRIIEARMSALLKAPIVVVNRAGAAGALAMGALAKAAPDGYTLASTSTSTLTVVPLTNANLSYGLNDFVPLGNYASDPGALAVAADAPWKTLDELVAFAKSNPGKLRYGSAGIGTLSMLNMETVNVHYGLDIIHVPFSGAPAVNTAVLGKHIEISAAPLSSIAPFVKAGQMRALLTTADAPLPDFPDVPTMKQKAIAGANFGLVLGLYAPAGIPDQVVKTLAPALKAVIQEPEVDAALKKAGMVVNYVDGPTVKQQLEAQLADVLALGKKLKLGK